MGECGGLASSGTLHDISAHGVKPSYSRSRAGVPGSSPSGHGSGKAPSILLSNFSELAMRERRGGEERKKEVVGVGAG